MIEIKGKIYRNIQEQVAKNQEDIEELKQSGGGTSYEAGTGIDITEGVISVDNTIETKENATSRFVSKTNLTDNSILEAHIGNSIIDVDNVDLMAVTSQDVYGMVSVEPNSTIIKNSNGTDVSQIGMSATEIDVTTGMLKYGTYEVATKNDLTGKQNTLISGDNIKTINNQSLLGSGNIAIGADTKVLAWTNSNPTSDFSATSVQLDFTGITNPKYIEIEWRRSTTYDAIKVERYGWVLTNRNTVSEIDMQPSGVPVCIIRGREFYFRISAERPFVTFENNYKSVSFNTPEVENSYLIPYKIYVIE